MSMERRCSKPKPVAESTARGLSTAALTSLEQAMVKELDAMFTSGEWKNDKKDYDRKQGWLNEIREELFHRQSGGEKVPE